MVRRSSRFVLLLGALTASAPAVAQATSPSPATNPLGADAAAKTSTGVTFTAPKQWRMDTRGAVTTLRAPEGDAVVAVVDVAAAPDAKGAAAAAWKAYRPDAKWPFKLLTARAARNGWDERDVVDYETSPAEHVDVFAIGYRRASAWTVVIVAGSESTLEKRGAAAQLVAQSLRPAGYRRETFAGRAAHPLDPARVAALRSFVEQAMRDTQVPGAAFALIDHGRLVYEGGLGVKQLGKAAPVDAHTLFMVASNTKGMSTLLLAELVSEGKLRWDEPVTKVYPSFRLGNDETTRSVLVKHLVCACTGLPRKDDDWIFNTRRDTPASTTFTQLAATQPTSGFGEVFQYNNLMASAAGYIAGHIVYPQLEIGAAYDKAMARKVFGPLGMTETTFSMAKAQAGDFASPHGLDVDGRVALASMDFNYAVVPYRPAGGAWSSAHDMIKYVQDEITQGVLPGGRRLVSADALLARRVRGVPTGEDGWYGMGLEEDATWGVSVIHHGGSMAGYKTDIMLVPDAQVGAVILTNSDSGQMMLRPFMRRLLEVLYDGRPEAAEDAAVAGKRQVAEFAKARERLLVPAAPADTARLADRYTSPELGTIRVEKGAGGTRFDFGLWSSMVASRHNDDGTLSFLTIDPTQDGTDFEVGEKDGRRTLTTRDGQHAYVYTAATGS